MGLRIMNVLAIKAAHALTPEVGKYLKDSNMVTTPEGSLYFWECKFTPMWARDGKGPNCVSDLQEEVAIQVFLGGLPLEDFCLMRAGEEDGTRGQWLEHPFREHEMVTTVQRAYARSLIKQDLLRSALTDLRLAGYAVVTFSPQELGAADPKTLENRLVELGNEAISDLQG